MARPGRSSPLEDDLAFLMVRGIGAIVSMTERPLDEGMVSGFGLRYLHLPVPDFCAPTIQQIEAFLVFLDDADQNGGVVVHCYAGQGRTGTMLACALVHQGMSAEEAIRLVRAMRPPSIDTLVQEQIIFDFAALRVKVTPHVQGDRHG